MHAACWSFFGSASARRVHPCFCPSHSISRASPTRVHPTCVVAQRSVRCNCSPRMHSVCSSVMTFEFVRSRDRQIVRIVQLHVVSLLQLHSRCKHAHTFSLRVFKESNHCAGGDSSTALPLGLVLVPTQHQRHHPLQTCISSVDLKERGPMMNDEK